jgi:HlyD family secretion protein
MTEPQASTPTAGLGVAQALSDAGSQRRTRWLVAGVLLVALLAAAVAWWRLRPSEAAVSYTTAPVSLGRLVVKVSATGNLQPTNQVDVGSELSGTVESVLVDDNDRVRKGQVLARLDTAKLGDQVLRSQAALAQAEAQVQQARATTAEAQASLRRMQDVHRLSEGKVPAATELASAEAAAQRAAAAEASARAAVAAARAQLQSDRTNVAKASIRSPIDGLVLARKVEPGQTVAASLQAPVLFTLAESLQQMELQVGVDEADVGQVRPGQAATFGVDAWPNRRYPARIARVGYGSQTTNNVVTYKTTLQVANDDLTLRPGMTATAEIVTLERDGVLLVPNAALRWVPPAAEGAASGAGRSSLVGSLMPRPPGGAAVKRVRTADAAAGSQQTVHVLRQGQLVAVKVTVGATDGRQTEVSAGELKEGDAVVTDSVAASR